MKFLRNIFGFILFVILLPGVYLLIFWAEMSLIIPYLNIVYTGLIILATIILWGILFLFCIYKFSNSEAHNNINLQKDTQKDTHKKIFDNPPTIIPKSLGGYNREQLNEIFLIGILIHQLYFSTIGNNMSEKQQKESLNIQMRFFITVFPQRQMDEYFDFSENFINKNSSLSNLSISQCIDNSVQILSSCNNKQIGKLRNLFNTLVTCYSKIGGGNNMAMNTFVNMLDAELSSLVVEDDCRSHYAKKKNS